MVDKMNILKISVAEYLQNSLDAEPEYKDEGHKVKTLCRGWDYLKANTTEELNSIISTNEYWAFKYNADKEEFIIRKLNLNLNEDAKNQLGSFVYITNEKRRDEAKLKEDLEREALAKSKGYTKTPCWDNNTPVSELDKIKEEQKALDHKKVIGLFCLSKTGLLGSFDEWVEKEGTLIYSESYNGLLLMPKRHTRTGYYIRDYAYVKVIE